jgi:hypothetical protein
MAVPLHSTDGALEPGTSMRLFPTSIGSTAATLNRHQYAVSPDGSFVLNSVVGEGAASPIAVILNFAPPSLR